MGTDWENLDAWIDKHRDTDIANIQSNELVNISNPLSAQLMQIVCYEQAHEDLNDKLTQLFN